jgi:hypothetical protein
MWDDALAGMGEVIEEPARVVLDVDYRILVTPDAGRPPIVRASLAAKRCVPGARDSLVWFSFCSNFDALHAEYSEHGRGCIARELIDGWAGEDLDEWVARVCGYQVDLIIDGQAARRHPAQTVSGVDWRAVRVPFDAGPLTERFLSTELTVEFHADSGQRRYPVKFGAYFVVGATQVTFEVADPAARIECDEYLTSTERKVAVTPVRSLRACGYRIRSSAGTVLPPGAGAVFNWTNVPTGPSHAAP